MRSGLTAGSPDPLHVKYFEGRPPFGPVGEWDELTLTYISDIAMVNAYFA
jgi:hypothetical protein